MSSSESELTSLVDQLPLNPEKANGTKTLAETAVSFHSRECVSSLQHM